MTHLVTGAKGFIGTHLCTALRANNHVVHEIDLRIRGGKQTVQSIPDLPFKHVHFIWHLAGPGGSLAIDHGTVASMVADASVVVSEAGRLNAKLVLFSSPHVYGRGGLTDMCEVDHLTVKLPYTLRTAYQLGKTVMECIAMTSDHPHIQIIRPTNVCGPGQDPATGAVLARLHERARAGATLTVYGDGSQQRRFVCVHDVVRFCLSLVDRWPTDKGIWNLSAPAKTNRASIFDLAIMVRDAHYPGSTAKYAKPHSKAPSVERLKTPFDEVPEKRLDWSKAKARGWAPSCSLESVVKDLAGRKVR